MDKEKRKKRIKFLWSKLRMMVKSRGLLRSLLQASVKKERELFGLDPSITQKLNQNQELESMIKFDLYDEFTVLPWYLINPNSTLY